jgi:hypothetical protein
MASPNKPKTGSKAPVGNKAGTQTKPKATGEVLEVVNPFDLWYLCEKASHAQKHPYHRMDGRVMYQRSVTRHIRADNEYFDYCWPYCAEVGYDMTVSPPKPIMSGKSPHRPSNLPLSYYAKIRNKLLPDYVTVKLQLDLLAKDELEQLIVLPLPADVKKRGIWTDVQGGAHGLFRIPDVVRLTQWNNPCEAQYSQPNLACVIEMKFPGDKLTDRQERAYKYIAGNPGNFRLLRTERCEGSDKRRLRREWMQASKSEPVYQRASQPKSLVARASADPYSILVGQIDAEQKEVRRLFEIKLPPPGTPVMTAAPSREEEQRQAEQARRARLQLEMIFGLPLFAAAASTIASGIGATVITEEVGAPASAKIIQFPDFLLGTSRTAAARRAAAVIGGVAAEKIAASEAPEVTSRLSPSEQQLWDEYQAWARENEYKIETVQNYLFWPDAPGNK